MTRYFLHSMKYFIGQTLQTLYTFLFVRRSEGAGFSLIELMVSVALFAVVMLVSVGSVMALVNANRKAQALQSVMNNLNIAIDGMVRTIRMGSTYHCGDVGDYAIERSCEVGDAFIAFEPFSGSSSTLTDQWLYWYDANTKRLYKSEDGGTTQFALTAPEIQVEEAYFYVVGAERTDNIQPKVVIVIRGIAGSESAKIRTTFSVQSTAVQRAIDI
jgi:prepilin-type N-terminal cleavage/methylation domain-containing protein